MDLRKTIAHNGVLDHVRGVNRVKPKIPKLRDDPRKEQLDKFREALQFDKNELDDALVQQPTLFDEVQEAYAYAISQRDELKTAMEEAYATAADNIRTSVPEGGKSPTDSSVKEQATLSKEYLDAVAAYQEAKLHADLLGAKVESFKDRSRSMKELTELYCANYWMRNSAGAKPAREAGVRQAKEEMHEARTGKPFSLKRR